MPQDPDSSRWLLLVHQLAAQPSSLRVKAWRRLQAVGSVQVKKSVYVLPNSPETREDFEWIRTEIVAEGGEALVFAADAVDDRTTDEVVEAFLEARLSDWEELEKRAENIYKRCSTETLDPGECRELAREVATLRNRAAQIDKIDYFQSAGRVEAIEAIDRIDEQLRPEPDDSAPPARDSASDFSGCTWVTRPHPGVDRMASAWLIRRFIDSSAEFTFAEEVSDRRQVPFDMFGAEFGHHGERCTFETLLQSFRLEGPALQRIGRIVHDIDLRSESPTDSETATVKRLVSGLRASVSDDSSLLEQGVILFEALFCSFKSEE
ncbi:MAG TPA: chromate resistance protein ChrB domain-containing protein [Acidobacteriota bacterium]|nr:chromate resistance protein ChrB domain-containing protein [Acidobacteriota bacterium]